MGKRNIYLTETQLNYIKEQLLKESAQDKAAINYLKSKGVSDYNQQMRIIGALKHDIPNLRLGKGKFLTGALRMYYDRELESEDSINKLNEVLAYIFKGEHENEYDFNLNNMSLRDIVGRFQTSITQDKQQSRVDSYNKQYTPNTEYQIVRIPTYEEAKKYAKYTTWCVTSAESAYDNYTGNGSGLFYFCLRNGFKEEQAIKGENCPLDSYGLSMIAVSVDMDGYLHTCTCRWNHTNGGNDNIMDKNQLEDLLGVNFYETFKPYTREELHEKGVVMFDEVQQMLDKDPNSVMFEHISDFYNGLASVKLNGKENFITRDYKVILKEWYDAVGLFYNKHAVIRDGAKWNIIDTTGRFISNTWYDSMANFQHEYNLAPVAMKDGNTLKSNYIDEQGNLIWKKPVNEWFDKVSNFKYGWALVAVDTEEGRKENYINPNGQLIWDKPLEQWFDSGMEFNDYGITTIRINGKSNILKANGSFFIDAPMDEWYDFMIPKENGFILVAVGRKFNVMTTQKELLWKHPVNEWFDDIGRGGPTNELFTNGFTKVFMKDQYGYKLCNYMNTIGELVWNQPIDKWFDDGGGFKYSAEYEMPIVMVTKGIRTYLLTADGRLYDGGRQIQLEESKQMKKVYFTESQMESIKQRLEQARLETNTTPTEKQKEAGNYKMGRVNILGFNIAIENPKGTYRRGKDKSGKAWQTLMHNDYGYFTHTLAVDGDAVDVFLGDNFESKSIFAIDQKVDGKFDETKVMLGFDSEEEAKNAYLSNYEKDWKGFWRITEVDIEVFKKWLYNGYQHRKPFSEYVEIKKKKLNESVKGVLNEDLDSYFEEVGVSTVINDFVDDMEKGRSTQNWAPLINPAIYQRALQVFTKQGNLEGFPEKYVYQWIGILMRNTVKLQANTEIAGHSMGYPLEEISNSYLGEYIKEKFNMEVIDWDYDCTVAVTPAYIIAQLERERLSPNEKEYIDAFKEKNNINEDAIHTMGPNKGQMAMFLSQPELDYYDNEHMVRTRDNDIQGIINIFNYHNSGEAENRAILMTHGDKAELGENGMINLKMDLSRLLDIVGVFDWMQMPDGSDAWSDFGLRPLFDILGQYDDTTTTPEQCLVLVNKALDVSHQRGDIPSIFIEGGSNTLWKITNSGYVNEAFNHWVQDWEIDEIEKSQQNGFIKLYHNTRMMSLGDILATGELDIHQHHSEGHGNMLFFTVHPDAWGNECKISIEVPVSEFIETGRFRFVNSDSVITEENIPISEFNFKIEKIKYFDYDRIKEILTGDDMELKEYLLLKYFQEYDYMWWIKQWFLNNLGVKEEDLL